MKRRTVPIIGLGSLVVGLVALACASAASAPTPTPIIEGNETPVISLPNGGPSEDIPMSEYEDLFVMARDDLRDRFDVEPESVNIKSIERVEWNDTSLGNPQPDMMYAQVITPGFKMVLDVQGESYTYHTSTDRVVFVADEQPDNQVTKDGKTEIVKLVLEWALVDKNIPDYGLLPDPTNVVLSLKNIEADMVPDIPGVNLTLLTSDEVQKKADEEGDFLFLSFQELSVEDSKATVSINNTWAVGKDSEVAYLSGGGCTLEYEKDGGKWVLSEQMMCWIS